MKFIYTLLALSVCQQYGLADISHKLGQTSHSRSRYLPPTTAAANEQLIVKEQYYKLQQQQQQQAAPQRFEESRYGNSRYQIFEVHNHYQSPSALNVATQSKNVGYLPPHEEIHIHHNVAQGQSSEDDNLDVSFLSFTDERHAEPAPASAPAPAPAPAPASAPVHVPFPSNYQHNFPQSQQPQSAARAVYRAPPYLPPATTQGSSQLSYQSASTTTATTVQTAQQLGRQSQNYQAPGYLPPTTQSFPQHHQQQQQQQQVVVPTQAQPEYKASDYSANVPLPLPLPTPINNLASQPHQAVNKPVFRAPGYLPPTTAETQSETQYTSENPGFLPAGYDYDNPETNTQQQQVQPQPQPQQQVQQAQTQLQNGEYRAPGYLPPGYDFANPEVQQSPASPQPQAAPTEEYRAPGYLPPGYEFENPESRQVQQQAQQVQPQQGISYREQLPQPTQATVNPTGALPDGYEFSKPENAEAAIAELHSLQTQTLLLQQQQQLALQQQQVILQQQQQQQQQQAPQQAVVQSQIKVAAREQASDIVYGSAKPLEHPVPPQTTAYHQAPAPTQQQPQQQSQYRAAGYLPPAAQPVAATQSQSQAQYSAAGYLPPPAAQSAAAATATTAYRQVQTQQQQQPQQQPQYRAPGYLPPAAQSSASITTGAAAATATTAYRQVQAQQQQQPQQQPQYRAPGYLPPAAQSSAAATATTAYRQSQTQQPQPQPQFSAAGYLPPSAQQSQPQPQQQYSAPDYLPPVAQPTAVAQPAPETNVQSNYIRPLSSYMSIVQPFVRYGQPVPVQLHSIEQHIQKHHQQEQQQRLQPQVQGVAPMYREQAKRPQYYAPAMSYASNAVPQTYQPSHQQQQRHYHHQQQSQQRLVSHQSQLAPQQPAAVQLNVQAQQTLQKLMPKEIQMAVNVAVAAAPPRGMRGGSTKVRTVQIVKPQGVRTFKVLETLDATGVKTIKILGTSNEQPRGQHQIVKVVTQNSQSGVESHVQTVKIYDDQMEFVPQQQRQQAQPRQRLPTTRLVAQPAGARHGYLPPAPAVARPRARITRQTTHTLKLYPVGPARRLHANSKSD